MSVPNTNSRIQYTLASATQTVAVPFFFLEEEHLKVIRFRAGVYTTLTLATHYTTTGENDEAGGSVIFNGAGTAIADVITIIRSIPISQLVDFVYNGRFPGETVERALDRLTMVCQALSEVLGRTIRFEAGEVLDGEMELAGRLGKLVSFNVTTGALEYVDGTDLIAETAANAAAAQLAQTNAETAQVAAELAETNAETAESNAELAQVAAELAETNAELAATQAAASAVTALNTIAQAFKGGIAGASVPDTSPLAGDYYRITSVGTSQGKTWGIGDAALYNGSSGSWTQLTGAMDAATLEATAALVEREGLRFYGTAGAVIGGGGIPAVGTGDFTFIAGLNPASLATTLRILGGTTGCIGIIATSSGTVYVTKHSDGDSGVSNAILTSNVPRVIAVARSAGVITYYADSTASGTAAFASNFTSTSSLLGASSEGNIPFNGAITATRFFNYALTASEIAALTRRGLVTLTEQRGGSMVALNTSVWSDFNGGTGTITSASASALTISGVTTYRNAKTNQVAVRNGQKFLLSWNVSSYSGTPLVKLWNTAGFGDGSNIFSVVATGQQSAVLTANFNGLADLLVSIDTPSTGIVATGISIIPLGTLFEQDSGQRNAGYMVGDTSGNGCHLELPESGVSIIDPSNVGTIRYTLATDGYIIGDRVIIPTGYVIDFIMMKAVSGTCTAYLGSTVGASDVVAIQSLTTAWTSILDPVESSTGKLYLTRSTGSVQVQVGIRLA